MAHVDSKTGFKNGMAKHLKPFHSLEAVGMPANRSRDLFQLTLNLLHQYHSQIVLLTLITGCMACTVATSVYFDSTFSLLAPLFCCLFIGGVYLLNWMTETTHDFINSPSRIHVINHRTIYWTLTIASLAISFVISVWTNKLNFTLIFLYVVGVLYSVPLIPGIRNRAFAFIRLKDITFVKSLLVATCFPLFLYEVTRLFTDSNMIWESGIHWFYLGLSIALFSDTIFDDMLDMPGDLQAGTVTVPIFIGKKNTCRLMIGLSVLWSTAMVTLWMRDHIGTQLLVPLLIQSLFPMTWLIHHKFFPKFNLLLDVSIEGIFWVTAFTILIAKMA
jgi:4-hydroxybenzoate polyprenyltransferase